MSPFLRFKLWWFLGSERLLVLARRGVFKLWPGGLTLNEGGRSQRFTATFTLLWRNGFGVYASVCWNGEWHRWGAGNMYVA